MAFLDAKIGQIRDRAKGYPEISYYIPKSNKTVMRECLNAHELLIRIYPRNKVTSKDLRDKVILFAALNPEGKQEYLKRLISNPLGSTEKGAPVKTLLDTWLDRKLAEGSSDKQRATLEFYRRIISRFFSEKGIERTEALTDDTAYEYIKWRRETNLHNHKTNKISASVLKHELQVLVQLARLAARKKWIDNGNLWDDVKVRATPGVDRKVVLSLSISEQKELLRRLLVDEAHHDMALLLLITGMRIGELATLNADSISNNILSLHEEGIGSSKPATGKTPSAIRKLPVCPTIIEIFKREFIFGKSVDSLKSKLKRIDMGVHAHRLRHTFAVNKLHAKADLKTVSYQMGHADISMTSNQYGVFVPESFKQGYERTIEEAKEWLDYLENHYFSEKNERILLKDIIIGE